jgi:hypothetical protein
MNRYNILDGEGGAVVNTIMASPEFMAANHEHYEAVPLPPRTPSVASVTPRQARLLLLNTDATDASDNMLAQAEAIFDAMSEPEKTAARIEWEFGTEVRRDSPLITQLAGAIGLTDQQIDAMFVAAKEI